MKRILISGGAGFIGSNLCLQLLKAGHEVIVLDNFLTSSKKNILPFYQYPLFEFVRHDLINPIMIEVDEIYHLACPASPIHYQKNPIKTIKTNILGTMNMLGLAKRIQAKILFASTSEVYGDPIEHPQKESYWGNVNPIGWRSCYDEGKRVAESLCFNYHHSNKIEVKIPRIFNTYGPGMSFLDGRVISNFIIQALKGKVIELYGDGFQTRSFCYVDDLVRALISMMGHKDTLLGPINLGNPEEYSIKEIASKITQMTKSSSKIVCKKPLPDDPKRRCPDISLAIKKLNWKPKICLEEGLKKTIDYFKKEIFN